MLKVLSTAEFATALGVSNASIAMAFRNGKLLRNPDKTYNIDNPTNKIWIQGQLEKGKVFDLTRVIKKEKAKQKPKPKKKPPQKSKPKKIEVKKEEVKEPESHPESVQYKDKPQAFNKPKKETATDRTAKYYEKKRELELREKRQKIRLDELKIKKIEGQLIPFEEAQKVFLFAAEMFRSTFKQEADAISNIYIKILGGTTDDFTEIGKKLTLKINDIFAMVKENLLKGLEGIQDEYKEVRGRGERK